MNQDWEKRVQSTAQAFVYPPTPNIALTLRQRRRRVSERRLAQVAVILLIVLVGLMAVPQIRAQVIAFFHIGAVEVIITTATPPAQFSQPGDLPSSVLDFPGATTLDDAKQHFGSSIMLPSALSAPDRVYLIDALHPIVVLAWLDAGGAVDVSLHLLPSDTYTLKMYDGDVQNTKVNGADALWLPNPHWYLLFTDANSAKMRTVNTHALVWESADGSITYRLETNRALANAVKIAESIPSRNG